MVYVCILLVVVFSCVIQGDPITNVHLPYYVHGDYATNVRTFCIDNACRYYYPPDGCAFHCALDFEWAIAKCLLHAQNDPEDNCDELDGIWFNKPAAANCNDDGIIWNCVINNLLGLDCDHDFSTCEPSAAAAREEQADAFAAQEEQADDSATQGKQSKAHVPSATVQVKSSKGGKYQLLDHINTGDMFIYGSMLRIRRIGGDRIHMKRYRQRYLRRNQQQQDELGDIVA